MVIELSDAGSVVPESVSSAEVSAVVGPVVVDLGYGHTRIGAVPGPDLTGLMDAIDADRIVLDGVAVMVEQRWTEIFTRWSESCGASLIIGHPSTWGAVRAGVLRRAAARVPADIDVVPRAVLIARGHTDTTVSRCAVVETTHLPRYPAGSAPTWDVQRLRRRGGDWEIEASAVVAVTGAGADRVEVEAAVDDGIEVVFVDGAIPAERAAAVDAIGRHTVAGRILQVDPQLIARWGARSRRAALGTGPGPAVGDEPTTSRSIRWIWVAAACATAVATVAAGVGIWQHDGPAGSHTDDVTVGRTTLTVPGDWHRSDPPAPSGTAGPGSQTRTVFAAGDDGSRILLVQSPVRAGSTPASVATSLHNRIRQRGDDVVTEFSPSTRYAGRDVISYREAPVSGAPIRWYVLVDDDLQVSVGCQGGTGAETIDGPCTEAVASVRIGPG
ncbi:type VII secretion-associated protein [Gordonia desulfuricans]|uniref:Type VII secretion-associated protein n=1 Tax=Gordonia desulfuricans TaxID=89051 RepID=A0A7K3LLG1_9ACTN|nr:type VII secretion-associated protein [Gordonia desulfuricans]NDK89089.1 type VII secretion-associated protein [Gordonia desulfuricans]